MVLPKPSSPEAMQALDDWLYGEVAPEDLPQVDEEAARVGGAARRLGAGLGVCAQRGPQGEY